MEVTINYLREAKELEEDAKSDLDAAKSDPSDAIVVLKNILASK
jgi:hypothetical protein